MPKTIRTGLQSFKYELLIFALLIPLFCLCVKRASDPTHWSAWHFGDAQTMMAVRNWQEEGFRKTHFLWIPQGYSHLTKYFDTPELSHHAHGSHRYGSEGVNSVRMYTHYPSGYALPYGVMGKLGIFDKTIYQIFSIFISFTSLFFFFAFLRHYLPPWPAIFSLLCFALSSSFLTTCDSLSGMPFNDLTRFGFLYAWTRIDRPGRANYWAPFFVYFLALLVSLDSLLFIPVWAIFERLSRSQMSWKLFLGFGAAGLAAAGLLIAQSISYLGWEWAAKDWSSAFFFLSGESLGTSFTGIAKLDSWITGLEPAIRLAYTYPAYFAVFVTAVMLYLFGSLPHYRWLFTGLFLAGTSFGFLFPGKAGTVYQGIQFAPAVAVLFGGFLASLPRVRISTIPRAGGLALCLLGLFAMLHGNIREWKKLNEVTAQIEEDMRHGRTLEHLYPGEKLVLAYRTVPLLQRGHRTRYPQVHPVFEAYTNAPILMFENSEDLAKDLALLESKKEKPIPSLVIVERSEAKKLALQLAEHGVHVSGRPFPELTDMILKVESSGNPPTTPQG